MVVAQLADLAPSIPEGFLQLPPGLRRPALAEIQLIKMAEEKEKRKYRLGHVTGQVVQNRGRSNLETGSATIIFS